ncbi:DUF7006 family protein [Enterococcus sp. AZ194]|uniref:DUF7006 family protein n=1 Tax=Enterococcus sp. AZ194 TaxID=2774629 RepID=UPI003F685E78
MTVTYFEGYDRVLRRASHTQNRRYLQNYYEQLKCEFQQILSDFLTEDYLISIQKVLLVDAKLQILFFFWLDQSLYNCTEEKIVQIVKTDASRFYQESLSVHRSTIPQPLILKQLDTRGENK